MKIYIAGPMRGYPQGNFAAFFDAEVALKKRGHQVFNPARKDIQKHGKRIAAKSGKTSNTKLAPVWLRQAMAIDCKWVCLFADAVALLPGWRRSKGARAEKAIAEALGLKVMYL